MTIIFILLNLIMIFSSNLIAYKFLQKSNFSEQLITAFLLYISQITFSLLFLGVVIKNLTLPFILILNAAVSFLFIFVLRKNIKQSVVEFYKNMSDFSSYLFKIKDYFLYLILLLFGFQVVLLLIKIYYLPPHVWDVFAYHLHPVVEWIQQNMIPSFIDSPVLRVNRNPMGPKLIHFWCFHFSGDIKWIELPQFIYGLIVPLTAYSTLLKINIKRDRALRYAILIYFIPLILIQSRTCQDHLILTGVILMTMLYFINVFYEKKYHQMFFLSLSFGLLLGTKINSLHIIVVFFLALLIGKGFNKFQILEFISKNKARIAVGFVTVLVLGGYWLFKSNLVFKAILTVISRRFSLNSLIIFLFFLLLTLLLIKGIKKFPVKDFIKKNRIIIVSGIIVVIILGSCVIIKHIGLLKPFVLGYKSPTPLLHSPSFYSDYPLLKTLNSRFLINILVFPFRIKDIGLYTSYTPDFLRKSGFGIQFFSFGLIAYILATLLYFKKRKFRKSSTGFILIFSIALLLTSFTYYFTDANYRLFMFFPVFGIILWAFVLAKFKLPKYHLKYIDALILIMLLFNMITCIFEGNMDKNRWNTILTINNSSDRTSIKYSHFFKGEDWKFIDKYLSPEEPIGYTGHHDSWIFPYFDNHLKRKIYHLRSMPGFQLVKIDPKTNLLKFNPAFVNSLKQRSIHFIHLNPQGARHLKKKKKSILIDDKRVYRVSKNLYYFKW